MRPTRLDPEKRFAAYWQDCDIPGKINEWGIKLKKSEQDHFFSMVGPLRNLQTPEAVEHCLSPIFWRITAGKALRRKSRI